MRFSTTFYIKGISQLLYVVLSFFFSVCGFANLLL